jgi:hypothetical protein
MGAILSRKGVKPNQQFVCCDCGDQITGQEVIDDSRRLHIVKADRSNPHQSVFRCELCEEERMDYIND